MFVQPGTLQYMVSLTAHIYGTDQQTGQIRVMYHNLILFFEAGDTQEGAPCFEVTEDTIVDKQIQHTATQLNTLATSPVKIDALKQELKFYDPNEANFLLNGFIKGFPHYYVGPRIPSESKNLKSALIRPEITQQKIDREVAEGRVAGPFFLIHHCQICEFHLKGWSRREMEVILD